MINLSKNNKETAVINNADNVKTHVVKLSFMNFDVSYAPTYIFRSNGYLYLNYN